MRLGFTSCSKSHKESEKSGKVSESVVFCVVATFLWESLEAPLALNGWFRFSSKHDRTMTSGSTPGASMLKTLTETIMRLIPELTPQDLSTIIWGLWAHAWHCRWGQNAEVDST